MAALTAVAKTDLHIIRARALPAGVIDAVRGKTTNVAFGDRLGERIATGTAEIVHGDAAALPWPDASFTVVTCMSVFEAFPDPPAVVAEVFRVLRPGGRAGLNIGDRVDPGTQSHRVLNGTVWVWAEDDVRDMVEQAGFTDVTIQYVPWGEGTSANRRSPSWSGRSAATCAWPAASNRSAPHNRGQGRPRRPTHTGGREPCLPIRVGRPSRA